MRQFQLNFWNEFKRIFCYHTGLRRVYEYKVTPWKQYDRLIDIPISEMKNIIKKEKIKTLIIDMDGTLKYYKKGLIKENKDWVSKIKKYVNVYVISNANKDLTSKVADELEEPKGRRYYDDIQRSSNGVIILFNFSNPTQFYEDK